jgi:D-alanyl-D-alanine carboxypeptidase
VLDVIGTSANLQPGDELTVNELLYGLMLPSGNDAAHTLAIHFGKLLLAEEESSTTSTTIETEAIDYNV